MIWEGSRCDLRRDLSFRCNFCQHSRLILPADISGFHSIQRNFLSLLCVHVGLILLVYWLWHWPWQVTRRRCRNHHGLHFSILHGRLELNFLSRVSVNQNGIEYIGLGAVINWLCSIQAFWTIISNFYELDAIHEIFPLFLHLHSIKDRMLHNHVSESLAGIFVRGNLSYKFLIFRVRVE